MPFTVFLADDHPVVRQGLGAILAAEADVQLVGEAGDGLATLRGVQRLKPNVLVLDLMMPALGGFEVARQVSDRHPETRIVVLSIHNDEAYVRTAFAAGAKAYVLKDASVQELVRAIREVVAGRMYVSPPLSQELLAAHGTEGAEERDDPLDALTAREREVLLLTAEGHTGVEISRRLYISRRTVESHWSNLMRKLRVRNQKELVRFVVERRLLPGGPTDA